jgi:hypothetical protein
MNWKKENSELIQLLSDISNVNPKGGSNPDIDLFYAKWLRVKLMCVNSAKYNLSPNEASVVGNLNKKYDNEISKQITAFRRELKANSDSKHKHFMEKIEKMFKEGEQNLAILPAISRELYLDARALLKIYESIINVSKLLYSADNVIFKSLESKIDKKISIVNIHFIVEGGQKDIEEKQQQLSNDINQTLSGNISAPVDDGIVVDKKTLLDSISFPDEDDEPYVAPPVQTPPPQPQIIPETPVQTPLVQTPLVQTPLVQTPLVQTPSVQAAQIAAPTTAESRAIKPASFMPISIWFPSENVNQYSSYRYCKKCNQVINPNTRVCTGCNSQY